MRMHVAEGARRALYDQRGSQVAQAAGAALVATLLLLALLASRPPIAASVDRVKAG